MESITAICAKGLVKKTNEDILRIRSMDDAFIICLCDGHWGNQAAELASEKITQNFPASRIQAIKTLESIQHRLYLTCNCSKPPETSILAILLDFHTNNLTLVSYGDCRLLISRNKKISFTLPTKATWLGAFSYKRMKNRQPVNKACLFKKVKLVPGDIVYMFSDGVDECVYETPTIPHAWIARQNPAAIMRRVIRHGAEDNVSLVVIKC